MTLLSFSSVMSTVWAVLLAILILLAMITVHEFGHYIAGKILRSASERERTISILPVDLNSS